MNQEVGIVTEEVKILRDALDKCFTESTVNEPVLYEQALSKICGISREALKQTNLRKELPNGQDMGDLQRRKQDAILQIHHYSQVIKTLDEHMTHELKNDGNTKFIDKETEEAY